MRTKRGKGAPKRKAPDTPEERQRRQREQQARAQRDEIRAAEKRQRDRLALRRRIDAGRRPPERVVLIASAAPEPEFQADRIARFVLWRRVKGTFAGSPEIRRAPTTR